MGNGMEMAQCGHPDGCCSGCSAVGAPRWARHNGGAPHWWHHEGAMQGVHGDGCSPVGALRSLQCRGCPAVVAPPRVRCSGAVRAGTAAMPWAHTATAARPPPHTHPSPGGSGQPTQQGSAQNQAGKGGAEIQPAEDPPSCERGAVPQPCSRGGAQHGPHLQQQPLERSGSWGAEGRCFPLR